MSFPSVVRFPALLPGALVTARRAGGNRRPDYGARVSVHTARAAVASSESR
jgi:hypothetical protein